MQAEPAEETRADVAYRWTIRAIYTTLIVGEVVYLWSVWKDTPAGIETRAKVAARLSKLKNCEPCARRRQFMKDRARMLWEAYETVESAGTGDA